MSTVYWDIETSSQCELTQRGAFVYAADKSTDVLLMCYAVGDGEVQAWKPDDPVPAPFADPAGYQFIADNWEFERLILKFVLAPRYGFAPIPIELQDCAQRLALANAFPAELGLRCKALGLPYEKDPEARKAMLRLCRPPSAKRRKKLEDPAARDRDLALLLQRCTRDVEATRACYNHPRLRPSSSEERGVLLADATINERGITAHTAFLEAGRTFAVMKRNAIDTRLSELTAGVVTSVFQRDRIVKLINGRGHSMTALSKRSVAATLAHKPEEFVRELLTLRQQGAFASVQKFKKLLAFADPDDRRIRGSLRFHGGAPGRWTSVGAQLHNLPRNDTEYPVSLVDALLAGDHAELALYGNPIEIIRGLSRAALRAAPGNELICADLSAIEIRVTAWLAGEDWKLKAFSEYDTSGDERLHPYRQTAARMLRKDVLAVNKPERQLGKCGELACGFGGALGAWRRIVNDEDSRSDDEVKAIIADWRNAHPKTCKFWQRLARAARISIRTGQAVRVRPTPHPSIVTDFDGRDLTIELPSGRKINYPDAHLTPNTKFENGDPDITFMDNARGQWKPARAWFGTLVENVVQGTARDLLATAIIRAETRGWQTVFHCHDELVIEAPIGTLPERDVLALLLEPPTWAAGLPLNGKVHSGPLFLEAPTTAEPPPVDPVERAVDAFIAETRPNEVIAATDGEEVLASLDDTIAPLFDLVSVPLTDSHTTQCPFHPDEEPSLKFYADHFHCYGCGEHGDRLDWLVRGEAVSREEAIALIRDWDGPVVSRRPGAQDKTARALELWAQGIPIAGTIAERYLAETRGIELADLPDNISDSLRFLASCPFGEGRYPCLIALMRHVATDEPVGIQRIALATHNGRVEKVERRALGRMGAVKLWPAGTRLVVGEGVETVLAGALMVPDEDGSPLRPAWSLVSALGIQRLPEALLARAPALEELIVLVDNDPAGRAAAATCAADLQRLCKCRCRLLTPAAENADFNDVARGAGNNDGIH